MLLDDTEDVVYQDAPPDAPESQPDTSSPPPPRRPTKADLEALVSRQVRAPLQGMRPRDISGAIIELQPTEQLAWATQADRALWGASVAMSNGLLLGGRPDPVESWSHPLEHAWAALKTAIGGVVATWSPEAQQAFQAASRERRSTVYGEVVAKLRAMGYFVLDEPRAGEAGYLEVLHDADGWPINRFGPPVEVRWGREFGMVEFRDPTTGQWDAIPKDHAPEGWRFQAQQRKLDDRAAREAHKHRHDISA